MSLPANDLERPTIDPIYRLQIQMNDMIGKNYNHSVKEKCSVYVPEWPRSCVVQRQFSVDFVIPELPNTADGPLPLFHSIIILSSPPDANMVPSPDQRTQLTHAE